MNYVRQIFDMQHQRNQVVGRDTLNDPNRCAWQKDYETALIIEAVKLIDSTNWAYWLPGADSDLNRINDMVATRHTAVNCFMQFMNIVQILTDDPEDNICEEVEHILTYPFDIKTIVIHSRAIIHECVRKENSDYGDVMIHRIATQFNGIFRILEMSIEDIFKILNECMDELKPYRASITLDYESESNSNVITLDIDAYDEHDAKEIAWDILTSNHTIVKVEAVQ